VAEADRKDGEKDTKGGAGEGTAALAPKSFVRKVVPYLIGGVISSGLGVTAGIVTKPKEKSHEEEKPAKAITPYDQFAEPFVIDLPEVVTSLGDPGQSVNGRFGVHLELRVLPEINAKKKEFVDALLDRSKDTSRSAKVMDALNSLFASKLSTDLKTAQGKELIKLDILDLLNPIFFPDSGKGAITNVYIVPFIVQ
jgi:flagellar basal body-associated protein FliL